MSGTAIRRWHMYIGMLTAPSLVFFCLTGAVQVFSLHEAHGSYRPFEFVEKLSSVHKDQVLEKHHDHDEDAEHEHHSAHDAPPAAAKAAAAEPAHEEHEEHGDDDDDDDNMTAGTLALKIFFLLASLALTVSAVLGAWIALTQSREKKLCWVLLATGTVLPLLLLALG
jgi:cation transport ATPase